MFDKNNFTRRKRMTKHRHYKNPNFGLKTW
jgi:hypothetical protein